VIAAARKQAIIRMDFIRAILRQYGANILAWIVFGVAAFRFWWLGVYFDARYLLPMVFAFGGLVAFVGSDEWAEYMGMYGVTREQYWTVPALIIRVVGGIVLLGATIRLFRL
jgi:hypothetical protein